jgi:putative endonuclease
LERAFNVTCSRADATAPHTDDLARRIEQHRAGVVPGFTMKYGVTILVWFEVHETRESVMAREQAMKKWNRLED